MGFSVAGGMEERRGGVFAINDPPMTINDPPSTRGLPVRTRCVRVAALMPDELPDASPAPEPEDAAFLRWLASPQGTAAMQTVMQDTVDGKHGEVPPELRALAVDGLAHRKLETNMQCVSEAMQKLLEALQLPAEAWESRWRHVRDLHEQAKAVTDLILEVPEPQRTVLMQLMLPLQETLARLERETK